MLESWIVIPDAHIPFEDRKAYDLVIRVARDLKFDGIISVGDYADCLSVSSHPKCPADMRWQFEDEVEAVRAKRAELDEIGFKKKIITLGNHETRGQRLASSAAIGLYETLDPDKLFEFSRHGWKVYPYQQHVKVGKINFVHDLGFCGQNAVLQNAAVMQRSIVGGHTHAAEMRYFGNADGENYVSATIGWLGDRRAAAYMTPIKKVAKWQHAFATMYVDKRTKNSFFNLHPIVKCTTVVNGKLYK